MSFFDFTLWELRKDSSYLSNTGKFLLPSLESQNWFYINHCFEDPFHSHQEGHMEAGGVSLVVECVVCLRPWFSPTLKEKVYFLIWVFELVETSQ